MDASERELVDARRWVWGALAAAVALLALGIHHSPPVISVHPRAPPTASRPATEEQRPEESTEQERNPWPAPYLWFLVRP